MVKISDAVSLSQNILKAAVPSSRLEAELLTAYVFKKNRLYLAVHRDDEVNPKDLEKLKEASAQRAKGKPLAYITGTKEFMSLEFDVNESVLIPRPETEELVGHIIEFCKNKSTKILDLCTGSGAICLSLAYYLENASCVGVDISPAAIETAKKNALKLGVESKTELLISDVLNPSYLGTEFDIVVSNPPYIESTVVSTLDDTVKKYEPRLALDGGDDGLMFYRKITESISLYLKKGGMLFFEIGYNQGEALNKIMAEKFKNIKIIKDLSGHDRIAVGQLA